VVFAVHLKPSFSRNGRKILALQLSFDVKEKGHYLLFIAGLALGFCTV